jgi:hypothetical protein
MASAARITNPRATPTPMPAFAPVLKPGSPELYVLYVGGAVEVADNVGLVEDDVTAATDEIEAMSVPAAIEGNPAARDAIADVGRAEAVPAADVSCPKMELTMPPWAVTLAVKRITATIEKRIFSTEAVSS